MTIDGGIIWTPGAVRVASVSTAGRRGTTTVKVELTVSSAWEVGDLLRQLTALRDLPDSNKPQPKKVTADA